MPKLLFKIKWLKSLYPLFLLCAALPVIAAEDLVRDSTARNQLTATVREWTGRQLSVAPDQVEIPPLDARLRVPACMHPLRLEFPFSTRDSVRASCENPPWQAYLRVVISPPRVGIVTTRALPAGHMLTTADLATSTVPRGVDGYFEERSGLIGKTLRKALPPGSLVLSGDIEDLRSVFRIIQPAKQGDILLATNIRIEKISGSALPRGAVPGDQAVEGARFLTNLQTGHILLNSDISRSKRYIITKHFVTAGQTADSVPLESVVRTATDGDENALTDIAGLENLEFSRNINEGEILKKSDLRPALLIRRGQQVLVTLSSVSGLELTFRAEALHDARLGEQVGLKNLESGHIIQGITTGKGTARAL
jgi:flagella basal body P-ring formation protein FlgA